MAANKTQPTAVLPADYVAALTDPIRKADSVVLLELMGRLTGEEPKMWGPSIIGFGNYHYKYASGREGDFFHTGFAPRKAEMVVYLVAESDDQPALREKLGKHRMGKSCLYIKKLEAIDMDVLEELITKSVATIRARYPS